MLFQPLVEFIEYLSFKVDESVRSLDGAQNREYHRLARFQQKTKDKAVTVSTLLISFFLHISRCNLVVIYCHSTTP